MGFSSQGGHVAFRNYGGGDTFPVDFATQAVAMKLRTGSLNTNRDLLTPDPEIGGGRDINDSYLGAVVWSGDYEFYARLNGLMSLLYAGLGLKTIKTPGGTPETQLLTPGGTITGGTFTITYSAQTTTAIPYNATAAQVQAALEALSNVDPGDVIVTGGPIGPHPGGTAFTLQWIGSKLGNNAEVTTSVVSLTGTSPTLTPSTSIAGTDYVGASVHTFWPSDAAQLPFIAIQEKIGGGAGFEIYNYTDGVVNTLHLEAEANGYLMGSAGVIARKQTADVAAVDASPLFDNLPMIVGTNVTVTYNAVSLAAKSFSLDLTNNFEDDDFRLGSFFVGDLTPKRREVTVGFSIREQDSNLWKQASYGSSAASVPDGVVAKQPLVINMATYETIPGTTPTLSYSMKVTIPYAILEPYSVQASGDDIIESDVSMRAIRPFPHIPLMRVEVTTPKTTVN